MQIKVTKDRLTDEDIIFISFLSFSWHNDFTEVKKPKEVVRLRNLYSILTEMIDYGELTTQEWEFGFLGPITCGKGTRSCMGGSWKVGVVLVRSI